MPRFMIYGSKAYIFNKKMFPNPNSIEIFSVIHIKDVIRSSNVNKRKRIFDPNLSRNLETSLSEIHIAYLNL